MKNILIAIAFTAAFSISAKAQMAVVDAGSIAQSTITAGENVVRTAVQAEQYAQQVQQYETQLQQLANQTQNTQNLSSFNWSNPTASLQSLNAVSTNFSGMQTSQGGLNSYLGQVYNANQFTTFFSSGVTPATVTQYQQQQKTISAANEASNADALQVAQQQQQALQADANHLTQLEQAAQNANGQQQALQANAQLTSEEVNQLQQLRAMEAQKLQMEATANQAAQTKSDAADAAAAAIFTTPYQLNSTSTNFNQ